MQTDLADMMASPEYAALPEVQRGRCRRALNCLEALPERLSVTGPGGVLARLAAALGVSKQSASRLYYEYKKDPRWQVFIDGRTTPAVRMETGGPNCARFKAWVQTMMENGQRTSSVMIKYIRETLLHNTAVIPGFEKHPGGFIPAGCSETSLRMKIKKWQLDNVRRGLFANKQHQRAVRKTRAGLKPGMVYEFDDMWHDHVVAMEGQVVRVLEFGVVDVASFCRVHWGHIPALSRKTDTQEKKDNLTRAHFILFLAYLLRYIGYHKDGVRLVMEHGTATLNEYQRGYLEAAVEGLEVVMGGFHDAEQKKLGGYADARHGNPDTKGRIERSHSGIHDMLAYLPGQVGKNRQSIQAATYGRQKEQLTVERWRERLTEAGRPDLAAALQNHILTMQQFSEVLLVHYVGMNGDRNHKLEGWDANTVVEYQTAPNQWMPADLMEVTPMMLEMAKANPAMVRTARLSPAEVWERGKGELVRIPLTVYVDMLGWVKDLTREVRVRGQGITIQDKWVSSDPMFFSNELYTPTGRRLMLGEGERVRVVFNPYCTEALVVLDERGGILGEVPAITPVQMGDKEALYEQIGRTAEVNARRLVEQQSRWHAETRRVEGIRERNRAIAVEGGLLPAPRQDGLPAPRRAARRAPAAAAGVDVFTGMGDVPAAPALPADEVERPTTSTVDFNSFL